MLDPDYKEGNAPEHINVKYYNIGLHLENQKIGNVPNLDWYKILDLEDSLYEID